MGLSKHELEACDLVVEVLMGESLDEEIADAASDLAQSENCKGIAWDQVDDTKVIADPRVQRALASLAAKAIGVLRR